MDKVEQSWAELNLKELVRHWSTEVVTVWSCTARCHLILCTYLRCGCLDKLVKWFRILRKDFYISKKQTNKKNSSGYNYKHRAIWLCRHVAAISMRVFSWSSATTRDKTKHKNKKILNGFLEKKRAERKGASQSVGKVFTHCNCITRGGLSLIHLTSRSCRCLVSSDLHTHAHTTVYSIHQ